MTTAEFREKIERRRERLENAADRARSESKRRFSIAQTIGDGIPMGQPILVGHHSEKGHRRDIARIDSNMRKGVELDKKADHYEARAASVGEGGISSDDPDAIEKLQEKLEKLQADQVKYVTGNKLVRKKDRDGLVALFNEKIADALLTPDFCGRLGFPAYVLSNNTGNMKRIKDRIESLRRMQNTPPMETIEGELNGQSWTLSEDVDENRIVIEFAGKPDRETLNALKSAGFKWSPTRGAHIRQRSNGATYNAKRVLGIVA